MNYRCIIVDDEQLARDLLEVYANRVPSLEVIAKCKSAIFSIPDLNSSDIGEEVLISSTPEAFTPTPIIKLFNFLYITLN